MNNNFKTVNDIYDNFISSTSPETPIIHFGENSFTAADLDRTVQRFIRGLSAAGCKAGTFVGYTMPNCPELFALFIAVSKIGGCCVPLFHMIPDVTKVDIYSKARTGLVVTTSGQLPALKEAAEKSRGSFDFATIDPNSQGVISFADEREDIDVGTLILKQTAGELPLLMATSSGTTGIPKPVLMTQSNIAAEINASVFMSEPLNGVLNKDYRISMAFPLSTSGIITVGGYLFGGRQQVISADISPVKFMELADHWKVQSIGAPPAYFEAILSLPNLEQFDLTHVKLIQTGMDFLSPSLLSRLKSKFVNLNSFANGYGLIETSNVFMCNKAFIDKKSDLSAQTSLMSLIDETANRIEVRDDQGNCVPPGKEGELFIQGANVVKGYLAPPQVNAASFADGWFKTGDIVRNEGDNRITLLGRKKYLIKRGGKSISPIVVQDLINKIGGVMNSAVVGIPHPLYGEMIWAFIVASKDLVLKDVMRHCRGELPNYMVPDSVFFIDEIPKTSGVGKVNFEKLKEIAKNELKTMEGTNE